MQVHWSQLDLHFQNVIYIYIYPLCNCKCFVTVHTLSYIVHDSVELICDHECHVHSYPIIDKMAVSCSCVVLQAASATIEQF